MDHYTEAFLVSRDAIIDLTTTVADDAWNQLSPLTPQWRVRDVLGHLCGVSEDVMSGNFPGADMQAWTGAQVARHANDSLDSLTKQWCAVGVEAVLNERLGQMLFDQMSHEFDIRFALGVPGDTASDGVRLAAGFAVNTMKGERAAVLTIDDEPVAIEGDDPTITLDCSSFEFMRATTGRRSWNQVTALNWSGDLDYVQRQLFGSGFFTPASFDVVEP
jgi:uncharacterized protein (TIGR03083 family)